MHLKALRLQGFKSFADSTSLRFEPGVTAVVGPNGCGKSNIADAIRWVLGEQSAKALRGGKMQDVIFEGADTRKPAQLCEVSLLLTNCEKQLGGDFHEIEIMRRVHRDGLGEYFFNGQPCRLRDIQKLFMDTGIGRTSYSIMAQGQIDQILSSKPEERRAVFEEAAGITKYKSQRREALQKLALTDQNLARVNDVIGEVSRQIGSLRRQASKALRHKKLSWRLRHLALAHHGFHHALLAADLERLSNEIIGLRSAADERRAGLQQRLSALDNLKSRRSQLNTALQDALQNASDLRSERERAEGAANVASVTRRGLLERLESSRASLAELDMQLRELAARVDTGASDKQQQLSLLGGADAVFQNRNRELSVVEADLSKHDQQLQQTRFQLLQFESNAARLRTDCSGHDVDQKTAANRHAAALADLDTLRTQQNAAKQTADAAAQRARQAADARDAARKNESAAQDAVAALTREFRDAQKKLQDTDRLIAQHSARLKTLRELRDQWQGFGEGAKAILQRRVSVEGPEPLPVAREMSVRRGFARAVESLLGNAVEAIHVADLPTAASILAQLEAGRLGAAVLHINTPAPTTPPGNLPQGLVPALDALDNPDPAQPAAALLRSCYITDDMPAFLRFWRDNPSFPFLAVATREGALADRRGLVSGGSSPKKASGIVQREIDLRETANALADVQQKHAAQRAALDTLNNRVHDAESNLASLRKDLLASAESLAAAQTDERNSKRALDELDNRANRLERDAAEIQNTLAENQKRFQRAQNALAQALDAVEKNKQLARDLEQRISEIRADRDVRRDSREQARLELAEQRQKVEVLDRGIADMQRRRSQLDDARKLRASEIAQWSQQAADLEKQAANQQAAASKLAANLESAQQAAAKLRADLLALENQISSLESDRESIRADAEKSQDALNRCEIQIAQKKDRSQFIEEDVQREFQTHPSQYDWRRLLWHKDDPPPDLKTLDLDDDDPDDPQPTVPPAAVENDAPAPLPPEQPAAPPPEPSPKKRPRKPRPPRPDPTEDDLRQVAASADWNALKSELDALRQRLGNMGAVNTLAIEEYADLRQRHDFLKNQCDDLTGARDKLLATIDEINRTSLEQFQITFGQIRKNFTYTFQTLFGGGVANLELIAADDILESGIEITAQPPGTKLKSISLLSGGQKTLTAVALLFALYMVKPSPFCLLDELDAPLDESNIGRFTDLLKKFVHESQFIIITHNKRTVAAASAIYGVTMEERGVSKTVSMRFNHARGETETVNLADSVRAAHPAPPPA